MRRKKYSWKDENKKKKNHVKLESFLIEIKTLNTLYGINVAGP